MIIKGSDGEALRGLSAGKVRLIPLRMGELVVYASLPGEWLDQGELIGTDIVDLLAPHARVADFTGYYRVARPNPAYKAELIEDGSPPSEHKGLNAVSWNAENTRFLPVRAQDRVGWPWPEYVNPFVLLFHSDHRALNLVVDGKVVGVADWAAGRWLRNHAGLLKQVRGLTDPVVLIACHPLVIMATVADQVGRMTYAPNGEVTLGAEPIDLADPGAGVMVRLGVEPDAGGEAGRFISVFPHGAQGDRVRWAYRERFGCVEAEWMAERFAQANVSAPPQARSELIGNVRRHGLAYFDRRDFDSRRKALATGIGLGFVSWRVNEDYRPGAARTLDSLTGRFQPQGEPWLVTERGPLPFDPAEAFTVWVRFTGDHFLVTDPVTDETYLEAPIEFAWRILRDRVGADRRILLITDYAPVSEALLEQMSTVLGDLDLVSSTRPAVLFLDDTCGLARVRIAVIEEGIGDPGPVWRVTSAKESTKILIPPQAEARRKAGASPAPTAKGGRHVGSSRARRLSWQEYERWQSGLFRGEWVGVDASDLVRMPLMQWTLAQPGGGLIWDFNAHASQSERWAALEDLELGDASVLEFTAAYRDQAAVDSSKMAWQVTGWSALPFKAQDEPLLVFADYRDGLFLLRTELDQRHDSGVIVYTPAQFAVQIGRRLTADREMSIGQALDKDVLGEPQSVVLLAGHSRLPEHAFAEFADALPEHTVAYSPSMPATVYRAPTGNVCIGLIRLPGDLDELCWLRAANNDVYSEIMAPVSAPCGTYGNCVDRSTGGRRAGARSSRSAKIRKALLVRMRGCARSPQGFPPTGVLVWRSNRWERRRGAVLGREELEVLARQTAERVRPDDRLHRLASAPGREVGRCFTLAVEWRDVLFPEGIAASTASDDLAPDLRGTLSGLVAAGGWVTVRSPGQVETMLLSADEGMYAMVVWEPAGQISGHGVVAHAHRIGETVRWLNLEAGQGRWWARPNPQLFAAGRASAVFVSAAARVLEIEPVATQWYSRHLDALLERAPARPVSGVGSAGGALSRGGDGEEGTGGLLDAWVRESALFGMRRSKHLQEVDRTVERWQAEKDRIEVAPDRAATLLDDILRAIYVWRDGKPPAPKGSRVRRDAVQRLETTVRNLLGALPLAAGTEMDQLEARYFPLHLPLGEPHRADTAVTAHIDGEAFFGAIADAMDSLSGPGDRLYFTSWSLNTEIRLRDRLREPDLRTRLVTLAARGVDVRIIVAIPRHSLSPFERPVWRWGASVWRYPAAAILGKITMANLRSVRSLRDEPTLTGRVLIDWGGGLDSRHEKSTVVYHAASRQLHAFVGGLDYAKGRMARPGHQGMAGDVWHDIGVQLQGGGAEVVLDNFWTRWQETETLPRLRYWVGGHGAVYNPRVEPPPTVLRPIRGPLPASSNVADGPETSVRVWRSYGRDRVTPMPWVGDFERIPWQTMLRGGVREIATGFAAAIDAARRYVYVEDQTLNPDRIARLYNHHEMIFSAIARALRRGVKVILVTQGIPGFGVPDTDATPNLSSEINDLIRDRVTARQWDDFACFWLQDTKVHSKLILVDDEFASIGSANMWDRSMVGIESEVSAAILQKGPRSFATELRICLWREHLHLPRSAEAQLRDIDAALGMINPAWGDRRLVPPERSALMAMRGTAAERFAR